MLALLEKKILTPKFVTKRIVVETLIREGRERTSAPRSLWATGNLTKGKHFKMLEKIMLFGVNTLLKFLALLRKISIPP